jgi:O-antigen ligase
MPPSTDSAIPGHAGRSYAGMILGTTYAVGFPVSLFAGVFLAPLIGICAAALAGLALAGRVTLDRPARTLATAVAALALWALTASFWSLSGPHSISIAVQSIAVAVCGLVLTGAVSGIGERDCLLAVRLSLYGLAAALIILLIDMWSSSALTRMLAMAKGAPELALRYYRIRTDRGATFLALALIPAAAFLLGAGRRKAALALFVVGGAALLSTVSLSAKIAFLVGSVVALSAWQWPKGTPRVLATGIVLTIVLVPLAARSLPNDIDALWRREIPIPSSSFHRLVIWRFAADRIFEHPVLGWGFDSSRAIPGANRMFSTRRINSRTGEEEFNSGAMLPLHPHNGVLQIWLELGVTGAALLAFVALAILQRIRRIGDRVSRAAALGVFAGASVIYCVSYSAWQSWWLAALWLVAALIAALSRAAGAWRTEAAAERAALRA